VLGEPGESGEPAETPPEIDRARDLGDLLRTTLRVWGRHLGTLTVVAGSVVGVVDTIAAAGLGELTAPYRARLSVSEETISLLIYVLVTFPVVTAAQTRTVLDAAAGRRPSPWRSIAEAADLFPTLLVGVVAYVAAVLVGSVLIVPAIYFAVSFYFFIPAVVADRRRGLGALRRSSELVSGGWWRVFGIGLVYALIISLLTGPLGSGFDELARAADAEALFVVGTMVVQVVTLSFVSVGATLVFFDLRARQAGAAPASAAVRPPDEDPEDPPGPA
jgi:hypothetical protein